MCLFVAKKVLFRGVVTAWLTIDRRIDFTNLRRAHAFVESAAFGSEEISTAFH